MQVPNGTGPCVRVSKRPLLASYPLQMFYGNLSEYSNKVKIDNKVQFGTASGGYHLLSSYLTMFYNIWKRGLHTLRYDLFIDHRTS